MPPKKPVVESAEKKVKVQVSSTACGVVLPPKQARLLFLGWSLQTNEKGGRCI